MVIWCPLKLQSLTHKIREIFTIKIIRYSVEIVQQNHNDKIILERKTRIYIFIKHFMVATVCVFNFYVNKIIRIKL